MGVEFEGLESVISMLDDEEILWPQQRRAVSAAAEQAKEDAEQASAEIRDTGYLEKHWKMSFYNDEGQATARVYSTAYHDIYNEYGSPNNNANIGFYTRSVERNRKKYYDIMIDEVYRGDK